MLPGGRGVSHRRCQTVGLEQVELVGGLWGGDF